MENRNQINTAKLQESLNKLKVISERVEQSLSNMNSLITETVGQNVGVWDGESATDFRNSWNSLAEEIPTYIKIIQTQINNIDIMKKNTNQTQD